MAKPTGADHHAGFIQAIVENPLDTSVRLIYADYLDDVGDLERSSFIRVQCELAQSSGCVSGYAEQDIPGCLCRYHALRCRERELLREFYPQWVGSVLEAFGVEGGKLGTGWNNLDYRISHESFRRGFVEEVSCTCADWLKHGPALVRAQPVLEVKLTDGVIFPRSNGDLFIFDQSALSAATTTFNVVPWARGAHPTLGMEAMPCRS